MIFNAHLNIMIMIGNAFLLRLAKFVIADLNIKV